MAYNQYNNMNKVKSQNDIETQCGHCRRAAAIYILNEKKKNLWEKFELVIDGKIFFNMFKSVGWESFE